VRNLALEKDVYYIAKLARLSVAKEEEEEFLQQFNQILKFVSRLRELDTKDIEPTGCVSFSAASLREDEVKCFSTKEEIFKNTKHIKDNLFVVPKVFEKDLGE